MQLDRLTRRILQRFKSHHHSTAIERLYLGSMNGGRDMVNLYHAWEREVVSSELYLVNAAEGELLQAVVRHQLFLAEKGRHSNLQMACNILQRYGAFTDLKERVRSGESIPTTHEGILQLKATQVVKLVGTLTAKPIHKVFYQQVSSAELEKPLPGYLTGDSRQRQKDW